MIFISRILPMAVLQSSNHCWFRNKTHPLDKIDALHCVPHALDKTLAYKANKWVIDSAGKRYLDKESRRPTGYSAQKDDKDGDIHWNPSRCLEHAFLALKNLTTKRSPVLLDLHFDHFFISIYHMVSRELLVQVPYDFEDPHNLSERLCASIILARASAKAIDKDLAQRMEQQKIDRVHNLFVPLLLTDVIPATSTPKKRAREDDDDDASPSAEPDEPPALSRFELNRERKKKALEFYLEATSSGSQ